jgi:hypothetical protein
MVAKAFLKVAGGSPHRLAARLPVAAAGHGAVCRDSDDLAGLDPADPFEEAARTVLGEQSEELGATHLIGGVGNFGKGVEALGHGREGREPLAEMVMERAAAERVAGEDQPALGRIPEGEGIVAGGGVEQAFAETLPGGEEEGRIGGSGKLGRIEAEGSGEAFAVVEPNVQRPARADIQSSVSPASAAPAHQRQQEIRNRRRRSGCRRSSPRLRPP